VESRPSLNVYEPLRSSYTYKFILFNLKHPRLRSPCKSIRVSSS
jgi:hypothetical protein